jgi:hypothetical protein
LGLRRSACFYIVREYITQLPMWKWGLSVGTHGRSTIHWADISSKAHLWMCSDGGATQNRIVWMGHLPRHRSSEAHGHRSRGFREFLSFRRHRSLSLLVFLERTSTTSVT